MVGEVGVGVCGGSRGLRGCNLGRDMCGSFCGVGGGVFVFGGIC